MTSLHHTLHVQEAITYTALFLCLWKLCGLALRHFLYQKFTVLHDLPKLGKPRLGEKRIKGTAVICGGSIAGLWTARICADHFEDVLIIEPDGSTHTEEARSILMDEEVRLSSSVQEIKRSRVSQYSAPHVYQSLTFRALKVLFPNVDSMFQKLGWIIAPAVCGVSGVQAYGGAILRFHQDVINPGELDTFYAPRDSYERLLRHLVFGCSNRIRSTQGVVTGLRPSDSSAAAIESVSVKTSDGELSIPAALVVDCTGGSQAGLKWLKRLYREISPENSFSVPRLAYKPGCAGFSRFRFYIPFEIRSQLHIPGGYDNSSMILSVYPKIGLAKNFYFIQKLPNHTIEFYFGGWEGADVPRDCSEFKNYFLDFSESHRPPSWLIEMSGILMNYKDTADILTGSYPELSWIKYEDASFLPSNFVALGDATMRVNPLFGQGCTKATIGAIVLDKMLRQPSCWSSARIPEEFSRRYFRMLSVKVASTWDSSKCIDYQWQATIPVQGETHDSEWFNAFYSIAIMHLAANDKYIDTALAKTRSFLAPPTELMHPSTLLKVATFWLKKKTGHFNE